MKYITATAVSCSFVLLSSVAFAIGMSSTPTSSVAEPGSGAVLTCITTFATEADASEKKWKGVDETVVGKVGAEQGHPAKESFLGLSGDALLFAFLIAGAVGGFAIGYYYRDMFSSRSDRESDIDEG